VGRKRAGTSTAIERYAYWMLGGPSPAGRSLSCKLRIAGMLSEL